jgi:hypothetical protein
MYTLASNQITDLVNGTNITALRSEYNVAGGSVYHKEVVTSDSVELIPLVYNTPQHSRFIFTDRKISCTRYTPIRKSDLDPILV